MIKLSMVFAVMTCTVYINIYGQEANSQLKLVTKIKNRPSMDSLGFATGYQIFKTNVGEKIKNNDEMIVVLKERFSELDTYKKIENQKRVAKLERRNIDLSKELIAYDGESEWEDFKVKLTHNLDDLARELKEFRE